MFWKTSSVGILIGKADGTINLKEFRLEFDGIPG